MMTAFFKANINIQGAACSQREEDGGEEGGKGCSAAVAARSPGEDSAGSGGVVASPDTNTGPGGSYYFHWARDGALSMHALQLISNGSDYLPAMTAYVGWVVARHAEQDPNGIDVRTEPKFELPSGAVFSGDWCRPQTDGPGLRAITLISFANAMPGSPLIRQYLWTNGGQYFGGAVKVRAHVCLASLLACMALVCGGALKPAGSGAVRPGLAGAELGLQHLRPVGRSRGARRAWSHLLPVLPHLFRDLPLQSDDFFWNRYTMRKALTLGATFAQSMGDASSAAVYGNAAIAINATLARHYNGQFVFGADNRQQDAAVICAFNNGYMNDGLFSPAG
jgi:glucoamylase